MWEILFNQHMAVKSSHFRNCKYTNGAEGTCCNRKNLSLCNVGSELTVSRALQTEERNISRCDISLYGIPLWKYAV